MASSIEGTAQIQPSKALGFLVLGSSVYDVLSRLRAQHRIFPSISVIYDSTVPLASPIVVMLDSNGLRLRFDGPDQRLRLIEVLDFQKSRLSYNSGELTRPGTGAGGPTFRSIYNKLFGPTYPGEYMEDQSVYVLSYPGVAFSFPINKEAWKEGADFVSVLSSSDAQPASSMAIFAGSSWLEARSDLFTRPVQNPRLSLVNGASARLSSANDEVEFVKFRDENKVEIIRRHSQPFWITLHSTTPQDLITELGPPGAIYRKHDHRLSIHRTRSLSGGVNGRGHQDDTDDTEPEDAQSDDEEDVSDVSATSNSDYFYNYFHHGMDIFISATRSSSHPVATKVILHGNVPGSFEFQRYRRARWSIELSASTKKEKELRLHSEMGFDEALPLLRERFGEGQRPMPLNRGSDSPSSSCELLGGWEDNESAADKVDVKGVPGGNESTFGNTELYGFPGFIFEVQRNKAISSLTVF
ncbi:hypothetical protein B9Z19DRAFT_485149 [Tuber borchii]|uniref:Uncharacterized protein n=1 Tax=Tuber borchii TaxID=42251 RepID=A0A2T6ZF90_TUBBO|nr:hypothetical protein B9Z19DRAFT_485149 [Tuber borchii]